MDKTLDRWIKVLVVVLPLMVGGQAAYSGQKRAELCEEINRLRGDIVEVLADAQNFGGAKPRFTESAMRTIKRGQC